MIAKGQHVIPAMHLRNFAGFEPRNQVWTYDATGDRQWSAIAEETAVHTHFYSVRIADGSIDTSVEEMLSEYESRAKKGYDDILAGKIPNGQIRQEFSEFLALMYARTPTMRRMNAELTGQLMQIHQYAYAVHDGAFDGLIRRMEQHRGVSIPPAIRQKVRDIMLDPAHHQQINIPQEMTLDALKIADRLAPLFYDMSWTIIRPEHGFFITSDNPLVRLIDPTTIHPIRGDKGFENPTAQVSFPLSPKVLLLMTWAKDVRPEAIVPRASVESFNRVRSVYAEQYLFAHIRHKNIAALARDYRGTKIKFGTSGFGPDRFSEVKIKRMGSKKPQ